MSFKDPKIWSRIKMKRIRNTDLKFMIDFECIQQDKLKLSLIKQWTVSSTYLFLFCEFTQFISILILVCVNVNLKIRAIKNLK